MGGSYQIDKDLNPFLDSSFTTLFNELYVPLCRFCTGLVGEKETAEDIVQNQFVYIWEHRERLGELKSLKSYLFTAVKHRSINHLKKQYFWNKSACIDDLPETKLNSDFPDPLESLENKELIKVLENALSDLPNKCRIIFTMKKFGGLSNKDIAKELGISVKTVESQMTIAFRRLLIFLKDN